MVLLCRLGREGGWEGAGVAEGEMACLSSSTFGYCMEVPRGMMRLGGRGRGRGAERGEKKNIVWGGEA